MDFLSDVAMLSYVVLAILVASVAFASATVANRRASDVENKVRNVETRNDGIAYFSSVVVSELKECEDSLAKPSIPNITHIPRGDAVQAERIHKWQEPKILHRYRDEYAPEKTLNGWWKWKREPYSIWTELAGEGSWIVRYPDGTMVSMNDSDFNRIYQEVR